MNSYESLKYKSKYSSSTKTFICDDNQHKDLNYLSNHDFKNLFTKIGSHRKQIFHNELYFRIKSFRNLKKIISSETKNLIKLIEKNYLSTIQIID